VILGYSVLASGKLFFGLVAGGVVFATGRLLQQSSTERAVVVGVCGGIVAAGFWTEQLQIVALTLVLAGVVAVVAYRR
jgi:hypothetical protein